MVYAKNGTEDELKELSKWKKLEESGAKIVLKRFINDKEVISKQELMLHMGKNKRTVERYIKDGMPKSELSTQRFQIFNIKDCESWRDGNIDKTMAMKTDRLISQENIDSASNEDEDDVKVKSDMERKLKADADDSELKVKLNELKLAEAEGRVVDADDLDKAMAEQAIIHKTDKTNDEKILPILLENKSASEIYEILHEHQQERLGMLDSLINKTFKSDETLFDIVEVILRKLKDGTEPESIIKRVNGSLI